LVSKEHRKKRIEAARCGDKEPNLGKWAIILAGQLVRLVQREQNKCLAKNCTCVQV
jgi:hypothetical protein